MPIRATASQSVTWLQNPGFSLGASQFTFSIPTATSVWSAYGPGDEVSDPRFAVPSESLATGFRNAIAVWDTLIAPDFVEVADNAGGAGELRIAFTDVGGSAAYAYSGTPTAPGGRVGDVWVSHSSASADFTSGYSFEVLLHEVGHTLGLKHSFDAPAVPSDYDSTRYTIMSYTDSGNVVQFAPAAGGSLRATSSAVTALTPMVLDILAAQTIYGAETTTRAGDDVYTFTQSKAALQTIYDAGGTDRLDFQNFTAPVYLDLTPGSYSSIGVQSLADQIAYWTGLYPNFESFIRNTLTGTADLFTFTNNLGIAFGTVIENATGGSASDQILGNDAANWLSGGAGNDQLTGGGGADTLEGGIGNDIFIVDGLDVIVEAVGGGSDAVYATANFALGAAAEVEMLSTRDNAAAGGIALTGNGFSQAIIGDFGANILNDGGTSSGAGDTLYGLLGDDSYVVNAATTRIMENAGEGFDTVTVTAAGSNFILTFGSSVEMVSAEAGTAPINITGNWGSQVINGNDGANILSAGGPDAPDTLNGGLGDDTYRVFATGDVINDTGGNDIVYTSGTSYFLYSTAAVETLSTSLHAGTDPFYLVGNGASQVIIGNYGDNVVNGRSGNGEGNPDTIIGLFGNDTYAVFLQGDVVREEVGQGNDIVIANVDYQLRNGTEIESISVVDQTATDQQFVLRGNEFAQTIVGNDTVNTLDGRGGNDTLIGRGGNDVFAFTSALGAGNVDTIQDFAAGDTIGLASDIFAGVADGGIAAGEFVLGSAAADGDDRLLYDQASGRLWYDADANGAGAAVLFAQLGAGVALSVASFVVVAPVADLPAA